MKIPLIILFPFLLLAQPQAWYVNPNYGAGTSNGLSWSTPFRFLDTHDYWENGRADGLDWGNVEQGDTIYISGGTDSVIYTPNAYFGTTTNPDGITIGYSPSASRRYGSPTGNPIVITKGWQAGHNGKVIFDLDSNNQSRAFTIMGITNVKFVGLTFRNTRDPVEDIGSGIVMAGPTQVLADSMITFDNCEFYTYGAGGTFGIATTKFTLQNSTVSVPYNVLVNGQDPFGLSSGHGGHTFDNNIIIIRNGYEIEEGNTTGIGVTVTDTSLIDTSLNMVTDYHKNNSVWAQGFYLQITGNSEDTFYGDEWLFDEYTNTTGNGVTTTDTSLSHTEGESWNTDILVGALITCNGKTMTITSNSGTVFNGSGGWSGGGTPGDGHGYTITGAAVPPSGSGYKWSMGGPHKDIMQFSNIGMAADTVVGGASNQPRLPITISNNLILDPVSLGTGWNALIYNYGWSYTPPIEFRIYNNIIVSAKEKTTPGALVLGRLDNNRRNTLKVFNNTFITRSGVLTEWSVDTLIFKNNLVICDTNLTINYNLTLGHTLTEIDYNLLAEQGGFTSDEQFATFGDEHTLSYWQGTLEYDTTSVIADSDTITFVNKFGETKASYYTDAGNGLAENLWDEYPFLRTDALGNARSELGAWDIGALVYNASAVVDTLPDFSFSLEDITGANLSVPVFAHTGNLVNFDSAWVSINRGQYNINGGTWKNTGEITKVFPNDDVYLRDTSASTYLTSKSIILTVGARVDTFTHTTRNVSSGQILKPDELVKVSDGKVFITSDAGYADPEPDTTAPAPPTSFVAVGGVFQTQFQTSWTNPAASDLDSIYYYEGSSNDTTAMTLVARLGAVQSYLRTGRSANTTYWCAVKAVDDSGNVSYFSNTDSATTLTNPESGQPLQNLNFAYFRQSTAGMLYDHGQYAEPAETTMPDEVDAYNTANGLVGYNAATITDLGYDYADCGDMIWQWHEVFYNGTGHGNTEPQEYIVDDFLTDTTYSIFQVTFGFACGALDWYGSYQGAATDTTTWAESLIGDNFKYYIRQMVYVMEQYPDKYFVLWTLYPPNPSYSDTIALRNASYFGTWMKDTLAAGLDSYGAFPDNIMIFDIRTLLDTTNYKLQLRYATSSTDPHPSVEAAEYIAPIYIPAVLDNARAYRRPD